ncbi:MAG: glycoside hydrolase family 88 protein, partial [Candidatus Marinimicrobia bacterium]|nr:glycoside hydrolase family 88 protein [Candidatus Neomarinimicrobiota bacterium]
MKYKLPFFLSVILLSNILWAVTIPDGKTLKTIGEQLISKDNVFKNRFPEYTVDGEWQFRQKPNWLSGFIGGELWYMYEMTGNQEFKKRALRHADLMVAFADIDYTHDMGFMFLPTCVETYQRTGDSKYRNAAIQAADMLMKRFNEKGQFIRAWGKLYSDDRAGLMIIDTMMNLELLFWAAKETGDYRYYETAYRHALTAMKELIRSDGSSYHVVEFNPTSGEIVRKYTHQGFADESAWARGQAWGIYGFTTAYQHTKDERFLKLAQRMADFFIDHLPSDKVPYWDLSLTGEDILRDASAGAIAASGLYKLADMSTIKCAEQKYQKIADEVTSNLINSYLFTESKRPREEGILLHTVYHYHKKWGVDESYPPGDYYLIEAIKRRLDSQQFQMINPAAGTGRQIINLNEHWYYLEEPIQTVQQLHLATKPWQKIDLPHTWNALDATNNTPGYRRDAGWYQKELYIPKLNGSKQLLLYFEGANIRSDIYVNGRKAGGHIGGYLGFEINITSFIKPDELNEILVRVDNSYDPDIIPSQKSDFFIFGGITRDLWLKVIPADYIERVKIKTPQVSKSCAETEINVCVMNSNSKILRRVLEARLINPDGTVISTIEKKVKLERGSNELQLSFPTVINPDLWSPNSPNLYSVDVCLMEGKNIIDSVSEKFGYRWFEFKEHGPFYLNGERLLLRGTHRHEEWAGLGNALTNELHRKDVQMIKEMGANFVRLAHYPQDPEVYRACDEVGLLVWDEVPWCRGGMGGNIWKQNTKRLLSEMIEQNFNHPSIIIWSLGNELYWLPDFEGGGDMDSLRMFLSEMNDLAHKLDPSRVTATRKFYEGADIVDIFSPSIWAGWYSGVYKNFEKAITKSRDEYKRLFHAEYGGSSHLGRHTENPITGDGMINPEGWEEAINQVRVKNIAQEGDWSENYIVDLFDWHLHVSENLDWFTGNAQWAFKDFGTP